MLIEICQYAADLLRADPYFSNVPVVSEDLGDPTNAIDTYLAKKGGIGVILMAPKANVKHVNVPGPYFDDIIFIASVWENVPMNRAADNSGTGKSALTVAEHICAILHLQPSGAGVAEALTPMSPTIALVPNTQPYLAYNVLYKTEGGVNYQVATVADITASVHDNGNGTQTVTLATTTPFAYIFFTTDGSYPAPLDASGNPRTPYSTPFTVTSPATIKCRAWMPGYLASKLKTVNA